MKVLTCIIIFLSTIIAFKKSLSFKKWFNKNILDDTFSFTNLEKKYEKLFGSPFPFKEKIASQVFSEKLKYKDVTSYKNGALLTLENELIPSIDAGLVIFIGEKEGFKCVTVDQESYEVTYCMLDTVAVSLYEHVSKGMLIGNSNGKILLIFKKDGEYLNYEAFI